MIRVAHPIPYQGSKRALAPAILEIARRRRVSTLYEPFAGSAAVTLAAASLQLASRFVIADSLGPLVAIWQQIIETPDRLADAYERIWKGQQPADRTYYSQIRDRFNAQGQPADLLYLLARCVKNSPRWNRHGCFNQSADQRRLGMRPGKMRRELTGAHLLLRKRTCAVCGDFEQTISKAGSHDLVFMDPPYEGTSGNRDPRYHQGMNRDRLIAVLEDLNGRGVPWLLSYDGRCGEKSYGEPLPEHLRATRLELEAGRSSQATLNGVAAVTIESLYVSHHFGTVMRAEGPRKSQREKQISLRFGHEARA